MKLITLKVPEEWLELLDEAVRLGRHPNRSAAIRAAIRDMLKDLGLWVVQRT